jgi:hypothetical protein
MKKTYVKPIILANEELAEGIYAASGEPGCWTVSIRSVQNWSGSHHIYEVSLHHIGTQHISTDSTVKITFNTAITDAYSESGNAVTIAGNTVSITRQSHANAYGTTDDVTYKVWVRAADEATTKALSTSPAISCTDCGKAVNVQGGGADGN